jgi:RNA recognition motif-containing protein
MDFMRVAQSSSTLFVGDLSIFCQEKDLFELFQSFGSIEAIEIKRSEKNKPCLAYGFIRYTYRESAEMANEKLNGLLYMGRFLRVNFACDNPDEKSPLMKFLESKQVKRTAQIHVNFVSQSHRSALINESLLRDLFSNFGEVVDVTINKTTFDQVKPLSYYFLWFFLIM